MSALGNARAGYILRILASAGLFLSVAVLSGGGQPVARQATTKPSRSEAVARDSLRAAADAAGVLVGAAADPKALADKRYADTLAREFNYLTPENHMKWGVVHPAPERWNFEPADTLVAFAEEHGMKVKGHTLIWHQQLPAYVNDRMSAEELRAAMEQHIQTLVGRYKGRVRAWDVVNEAVDDQGGLRKSLFLERLGEGYIAEAFRLAHAADPEARLIYNDYGAEGLGAKSERVYELVKNLVSTGVPIHGVGLQMHISAADYPKPKEIAANIDRLTELGLQVNISEMDVRIKDLAGDRPARLDAQRRVYRYVLATCLSKKGFTAVTFWGFSDAHSWVDSFFGPDDPLLFDERYQPKPAYQAVRNALRVR